MLEMILLFKWTIIASMISAGVLAFIGVQLSSKAKSKGHLNSDMNIMTL